MIFLIDEAAEKEKEEWLVQAKKELEDWDKSREEQLAKTKEANRLVNIINFILLSYFYYWFKKSMITKKYFKFELV